MSLLTQGVLVSCFLAVVVRGWTISLPSQMPDDISQGVSPQFPAFGFEPSAAVQFFQDPQTKGVNEFSRNLVKEITRRTGGKAVFRLGSDPADRAPFVPDQVEPVLPIALPFATPYQGLESVGPSFWNICRAFEEADYIVGVPLALTNISETVAWASSSASILGLDRIIAFEVGNEPNAYGRVKNTTSGQVFVPPEFYGWLTNQSYSDIWRDAAANITSALKLPPHERIFQAFDWASITYGNQSSLDMQQCLEDGLDQSGQVRIASQHYYAGTYAGYDDLGPTLMNHTAIKSYLDYFGKHIDYLHAWNTSGTTTRGTSITTLKSGIPLILGEVGDLLPDRNEGSLAIVDSETSVLGSALWQVDVQLYAMHLGISMINFQQNVQTAHPMWLPVGSVNATPAVFGLYYAQVFIADFIGQTEELLQVSQVTVGNTNSTNVVAYAGWVNGTVSRLAMVNFDVWDGNDPVTRPAEWINIDSLPEWCSSVDVVQLNSPDGAHANASSITYAGSQWTYESMGKEITGVRDDTKSYTVKAGSVSIELEASSGVIVWLK